MLTVMFNINLSCTTFLDYMLSHAAPVYAVATKAAVVIFVCFISHFIHRLLTVIVWIQV